MKVHFLGDIHGDFGELTKIADNVSKKYGDIPMLQLGDMGIGFIPYVNKHTGKVCGGDPESLPENLFFFAGNHDNREKCKTYPNYLGDFGYNEKLKIFFISGAWSIDMLQRTPGLDWWYNEELDYSQLQEAIDLYDKLRPEVVVSHTCPYTVSIAMNKITYAADRTQQAMDTMLKIHRPKLWIFGHFHHVWEKTIKDTKFVCLAINQVKTFNI